MTGPTSPDPRRLFPSLSAFDALLTDGRSRRVEGWRRSAAEFLWFGIKEARACLFAGLFFTSVLLVPRAGLPGVPRYDALLAAALAIQLWLLRSGLETRDEPMAICLFHALGDARWTASGACLCCSLS